MQFKITIKKYGFADAIIEAESVEEAKKQAFEANQTFRDFDIGYQEIMAIETL